MLVADFQYRDAHLTGKLLQSCVHSVCVSYDCGAAEQLVAGDGSHTATDTRARTIVK